MSRKFRLFSAACITLLVVSIGFNIALAVSEGAPEPGSDKDPLISKSYVDQSVSQFNQQLLELQEKQTQQQGQMDQLVKDNETLVQKLAAQDAVIKALQDELKKVSNQTPAPPANTGTPANSGTSGNTVAPPAGATLKGTITVASLRVRAQANTTSAVVASAVKGEVVTIVTKGGEWHKIKTAKGITGYVLAKYVSIKK